MTPDELRRWREGRGMTQQEAADWYGVKVRSWRRYETGERRIPRPLENRMRLRQDPRRPVQGELPPVEVSTSRA